MKKTMKKFASLALALIMALALAVPAMAAPVTTTITAPDNDHTYEVYQIFVGDLDGTTLSNVKWGANGTGAVGGAVEKNTLDALEGVLGTSDTDKLAVIEDYVNFKSTPVATIGANSKDGTKVEVPTGYYLIKDLGVKQDDGTYKAPENETLSLYVVQIVGATTITPKIGRTTVDKNIVEGDDHSIKANDAAIGDIINYEIVGTIPENIADFEDFYYVFTDTLSKGLTFRNDVKVTVNDVDVTSQFYVGAKEGNDGATVITIGVNDLLTITGVGDITPTTKVVVTYSAELNENAVVGTVEGNPNDVYLEYSSDPNDHSGGKPNNPNEEPKTDKPTGKTPESTVKTYTTKLTITKRADSEDGAFLPGTEFTLTGETLNKVWVTKEVFVEDADGDYWLLKDGTYTTEAPHGEIEDEDGNTIESNEDYYASTTQKYSMTVKDEVVTVPGSHKVTDVVNDDGTVTFTGLKEGVYTLSETKTLPGYNTVADVEFAIVFTVDDHGNGSFAVKNVITREDGTKVPDTESENKTGIEIEGVNELATTIVNVSGSTLPETGGIGTTIFTVVGGILVVGAAVLLVVKKRVGSAD